MSNIKALAEALRKKREEEKKGYDPVNPLIDTPKIVPVKEWKDQFPANQTNQFIQPPPAL